MLNKNESTALLSLRDLSVKNPKVSVSAFIDATNVPMNRLCRTVHDLTVSGLMKTVAEEVNGSMDYFYELTEKGAVVARILDIGIDYFIEAAERLSAAKAV